MRMIAGGGGGGLTVEQPELNIVRGAYYALISALSGTQTMALCSYDEAYTIPSERSARISLRTMQLLVEEMGLADTVDPLGGSYYIETLTNQMEAEIRRIMAEVDRDGGVVEGVSTGRIQAMVAKQALQRQRDLESGAVRKVGVNCYRAEGDETNVEFHPFKADQAHAQQARLEGVKKRRDGDRVRSALEKLGGAATAGANVMPQLIEAAIAHATVSEMIVALKHVYGEYAEPVRFA
jgi:methylmalonyl-CoA mutase N-terminal domain/subunit